MVRRRSTVRFRKGAPRSGAFFDTDTVTSLEGIPAEGTGQRLGLEPESSRGRRLRMVRGSRPGRRGSASGALWGARSLPSGLERCVQSGRSPRFWPPALLDVQRARRRVERWTARAVTQRAGERADPPIDAAICERWSQPMSAQNWPIGRCAPDRQRALIAAPGVSKRPYRADGCRAGWPSLRRPRLALASPPMKRCTAAATRCEVERLRSWVRVGSGAAWPPARLEGIRDAAAVVPPATLSIALAM
jgi:hypothetical protein